jgi:ribosomal protein L11 methylase PrmA
MIFPDRKDFWQARHAKFGHTGWASRKIYAFDQFVRLSRFVDLLDENNIKPGVALDFGCGAGDFSRVLLDRGWSVVAYDPFVDPQICRGGYASA